MKLKKLTLISMMALVGQAANASTNAIPMGPNLGYGDASNNNTIYSTIANPAWISGNIQEENNVGLALSGTVKIEQKGSNELMNGYDNNVKPILDKSTLGLSDLQNLETQFNSLILDARNKFYSQQDVAGTLPMAFSHGNWGGFGVEISGGVTGRESILSGDKPLSIDSTYFQNPSNSTATKDVVNNAVYVNSALYIKTAVYSEAALTYGNQFYHNQHGRLSVGLRAKYMQAKLVKTVSSFQDYLLASVNGDSISDKIKNDLDKHTNGESSSAVGVDLGASWFAENWMAGITVMNMNSPSFTYNTLGVGTTDQAYLERSYSNQINLSETVKLEPQGRIEGQVYSQNRHWTLAGSYDVNEATNYVGQAYQWATVSASYASDFGFTGDKWYYALIPDVRIGYRSNLAGDKQSFYTPGFTWGPLNLDVAFNSFDDISNAMEGKSDKLPQGFMASLGLEFYF